MTKMRMRYLFDILLTAVLIFEMLYQFTGNFLHEVVGMSFALFICLHLILSRKWISATSRQLTGASKKSGTRSKTIAFDIAPTAGAMGAYGAAPAQARPRKKMTGANKVRLVLAVLLCICMVVLLVTSLVISNIFFTLTGIDLAGDAYHVWVLVHTVSSYALCIVTAIHLAVHWAGALSAFKIPYNHERRQAISTGVGVVTGLGVLLIGASGAAAVGGSLADIASLTASQANAAGTPEKDGASGGSAPLRAMRRRRIWTHLTIAT